jgi:hypothetical protein
MNEIDNRYLDLYKAIWVQALKQEFKAQKWRLTRDVGAAKQYFPKLRKAVQRKIWREHEAWPENYRGRDMIYEKEYQDIVKEATNDKERVAGNTESAERNSSIGAAN